MNQQALNNNFNDTLFEHHASIENLTTRIAKLENDARADVKQPGPSPHRKELDVYERTINGLREELGKATHHAGHLEAQLAISKQKHNEDFVSLVNERGISSRQYQEMEKLRKELADAEAHGSNWHSGWESSNSRVHELEKENEIFQSNAVKSNRHINELSDQLQQACRERDAEREAKEQYKEGHDKAASLVAKMHMAAMGGIVCGPKKGVVEDIEELRRERDCFKFESDNQAAAWSEIKTLIPDVNGLSLVAMVRDHIQNLTTRADYEKTRADGNWDFCEKAKKELEFLKLNNRYQSGFEDGANATIRQVREMAAKLKS